MTQIRIYLFVYVPYKYHVRIRVRAKITVMRIFVREPTLKYEKHQFNNWQQCCHISYRPSSGNLVFV